jgi:hypothetical protein
MVRQLGWSLVMTCAVSSSSLGSFGYGVGEARGSFFKGWFTSTVAAAMVHQHRFELERQRGESGKGGAPRGPL